ncbi:MraY family glycosyltransferase [Canibacter zhoujuaniae]|uniref:MraY family glycosyltransferase n=1 Tax=Canibacter zhoujuaniae TaxID=2708343 RepID=UPI0014241FCD|nr:MraY family glycosyltransferase [Canibacter zhoujuaniae]
MTWFAVVLAVAAGVSFLLSFAVLKLAHKFHLVSAVRGRDVHKQPTPRLGGVAMYGGFLVAFIFAYFTPALRGVIHEPRTIIGLLAAATIVCFVGVLDDLFDLDWMVKLGAQFLAAGVLVWQGVQFLSLPLGDTLLIGSPAVNMLITVFLIALTMNAVNFIDGMDGLAAGFAIIAAASFFIYTRILAAQTGESSAVNLASLIVAILAGVCLGFLPYNWHQAKMFMGDTGALLIGLLLAAATITATGQLNPAALSPKLVIASYMPIILPILLMALPLADMTLAVIRRLRAGQSPFTADRKHLHHRLLDMGHSPVQVVMIFYLGSAVLAATSLLVFTANSLLVPLLVFLFGSALCLAVTLVPARRARGLLSRKQ